MKLFIVMRFMEYSSSFFSSELYDFTTTSSYKNLASLRILTYTFNLWIKRLNIRVSQIMMLLLDKFSSIESPDHDCSIFASRNNTRDTS
jgi:hypothetical protein